MPLIMPYVAGVPQFAIRAEVVRAAIKFCEATGVWQETMTPIDVVAATATYAIPAPASAQNIQVEELYYKEKRINPVTTEELRAWHSDWMTETGTPYMFTQTDPDRIILVPTPEAADAEVGGLTGRVLYKPTMTATQIPDFLFNQYGFGIAAGAIHSLCAMPNRSWSNPGIAQYFGLQFRAAMNNAKIDASKAFSKAEKRVRCVYV
jgi:hypothetical protein